MRKSVLALALVALLPGCGDEQTNPANGTTSTTEPGATIARIAVTVNPVLVPAVATADPNFPWAISWQTTVRESAGIGATVTTIDVHLVDAVLSYTGSFLSASSTNGSVTLAARGTLTFNESFFYSLPDGGRLAVVSVVVWLRDARGNVISEVAQLRII